MCPRNSRWQRSLQEQQARRTLDLFEIPGHHGSLRSAGVGSSIAGLPADGVIIDDPFGKREDADSPVVRRRVWDWYANDLYGRLSAKAWVVLTHTRWHRDDLAGQLLRKMADRRADQWEVLSLPAVRGEGPGDPSDPRGPGEVLWPEFKTAADLEVIRRQDARAYAALYQQDPTDGSMAEWALELFGDWIWVPPENWPKKFGLRVVCVDPSKGASDRQGDYCAIVFMGLGEDRLLYVDAILERIPLDQIVRKTVSFCDQYKPDYVGIEVEQFQQLLVHEFQRQCRERPRWPIYEMKTGGVSKVARIRRLSQYVINRELRFKADSPGCRLLVDQLIDFPLAEHDDGPDVGRDVHALAIGRAAVVRKGCVQAPYQPAAPARAIAYRATSLAGNTRTILARSAHGPGASFGCSAMVDEGGRVPYYLTGDRHSPKVSQRGTTRDPIGIKLRNQQATSRLK